ncbi:MAG: ISAs1 family transposase [Chloroflexota bacterium]
MISQSARPLIEVLAEIEDPRQARGVRHPVVAILALVCVATLCGYRSYSAMAEWGRHYGAEMLTALGFTRSTAPSAATLCRVLRGLDGAAFDAAIGRWAEGMLATLPAEDPAAIALDGKTLRGSRKQRAPGSHLLAAVSRRLGLPLAQVAVDDKTNEIGAVQAVLRSLVLEGRVLTMDALLTQRAVAQTIVSGGGDYVMVAKENQPGLVQGIAGLLATPAPVPGATPLRQARTVDRSHGRVEWRAVTARAVLPGDCDWPGVRQVFRLERRRVRMTTGVRSTEVTYGVTSFAGEDATPQRLLRLLRGHWHIENRTHWVRDVTFDEDRSQVRVGALPRVLATTRTAAISLLRGAGATNIAAACRRNAAQPWQALALIGIQRQ